MAYWPGIPGYALATRWGLLAVALPLLYFRCKVRITTAHWIGLLLVIYAGISALWSPVFVETLDAVAKFTIISLAFLIGAETKDARGVYSAMSLGIAVNGVLTIAQSLGDRKSVV